MITISINIETYTKDGMAETLRYIANQIEEGYTSSYDPAWELFGEEKLDDEDE